MGPNSLFRWLAVVTYRTDAGTLDVEHTLEDLVELHGLVEHGPHWDTIERITIIPIGRLTAAHMTAALVDVPRESSISEGPLYRWHAVVAYLTDRGPLDVEYTLEELMELHDFAERGPPIQLATIIRINHVTATDLTVEQAEKL